MLMVFRPHVDMSFTIWANHTLCYPKILTVQTVTEINCQSAVKLEDTWRQTVISAAGVNVCY